MRNLLLVHCSCGHTEVTEVSDDDWTQLASRRQHTPFGSVPVYRSRTGTKTRTVYVKVGPMRFYVCTPCANRLKQIVVESVPTPTK